MARILIADQVSERRNILCTFLRGEDHVIIPVGGEEEALKLMREVHPELIIVEGTVGGAKIMSEARELDGSTAVIIILGGPPGVEQVVELMNQGVSDILVSPLDINDVQTKVERAINRRPGADAVQIRFRELVGPCQKMQQVFRKIIKASVVDSPVLIIGEKGTGKRLVAGQIHDLSNRKDRTLRFINCAAIPATTLEIELFGQETPAPGAVDQRRQGLVELTNGGSLCLQEVTNLTSTVQMKLLTLLEDHVVERLGGDKPLSVDVRLLIASSDLYYKVQEGSFQSDLYYALSTCVIELPPLRSRINDIPDLVDHFLGRYDVQIAPEAVELLMNYSWPGNVDELKNAMEQAVNACDANRVELKDLPERVLKAVARSGRRHKFIPPAKEPNG